ncbi:MAG: hypothetical protein QOH57_1428, partial [Mycobacterium sp.]|nr:hypothetical protein [Mycobacterium sp.]
MTDLTGTSLAVRLAFGDEPPAAVLGYDERVVTHESLLADAALADLIALRDAPPGPRFVDRFRDRAHGGFHQVIERNGVVSMAGRHRRLGSQALAYLAAITRADASGDVESAVRSREEFTTLLAAAVNAKLATTYLPGMERPIDRQRRLTDVAWAFIAAHDAGLKAASNLGDAIFEFFDDEKGVFWEVLEPTGEPDLLEGHYLAGNALALLALHRMDRAGVAVDHE